MLDIRVVIRASIWSHADSIGNIPKVTFFVFMLDFNISKGCLVMRAVVHELFAAVDHAVIPHFLEGLINAGDDVFVESKS